MTLPDEWFISMRKNRDFLFDLLNPEKTPKVPREIRKRASECLKHFPMTPEIDELEKMYNASVGDRNVILDKTNKELNHISNEIHIAQRKLNDVASVLQHFINKT